MMIRDNSTTHIGIVALTEKKQNRTQTKVC